MIGVMMMSWGGLSNDLGHEFELGVGWGGGGGGVVA